MAGSCSKPGSGRTSGNTCQRREAVGDPGITGRVKESLGSRCWGVEAQRWLQGWEAQELEAHNPPMDWGRPGRVELQLQQAQGSHGLVTKGD